MESLRHQRSKSGVFLGKDGFVTPRDLLRGASSKQVLAREGYMLLAERLRTDEEKGIVKKEIESCLKVAVDMDSLYYGRYTMGESSESRALFQKAVE
jgi:midasin